MHFVPDHEQKSAITNDFKIYIHIYIEACYEISTGYITDLEGLIMPETSLSIVRVVIFAKRTPTSPKADSAMLSTVLARVGRARVPTWHLACTFRCSNLTSTFGRLIPTLHM